MGNTPEVKLIEHPDGGYGVQCSVCGLVSDRLVSRSYARNKVNTHAAQAEHAQVAKPTLGGFTPRR